jgi:hypothetical protein
MTRISDRADLGYFPLQDFSAAQNMVPVSVRQSIAGARIVTLNNPTRTQSSDSLWVEVGQENGMGTIGDVHPWFFWQTRDRSVRGNGAWSQVFGTVQLSTADRYAGVSQPIRDRLFNNDSRFVRKALSWPVGFQSRPRGALLLGIGGTEESAQHSLAMWVDPRLIAPSANGPGECGTLVVDLQPTGEICMGGSTTPGVGGRHARLQSLVRVITGGGSAVFDRNVLALNYSLSVQDSIAGLGAIFAQVVGGVATSGGSGGPVTPNGPPPPSTPSVPSGPTTPNGGSLNATVGRTGTGGGSNAGTYGAGLTTDGSGAGEQTPNSFGTFSPTRTGGHAVALMAAMRGYGPIHAGHQADKHNHGVDGDGHPVNSAHVSTGAYFFRDRNYDGPLFFEGDYPFPPSYPLTSKVHLTWNKIAQHAFAKGPRDGLWMWFAEVPYYSPSTPTGGPPPGSPPTTPPGTPPGGPGTPTTPGGPATPGVPPPGVPPPPGGPANPGGPATPGAGTPPPGGPPPPGLPAPTTPWAGPPTWGGPPPPGGGRIPGGPTTPNGGPPPDPGGGDDPVPGQRTGGGSDPAQRPAGGGRARPPDPNNPDDPANRGGSPTGSMRLGSGAVSGNTRRSSTQVVLNQQPGTDPWSGESNRIPGLVERVGSIDSTAVGLYSILHPFHEAFAAIAFRPQLWLSNSPRFETNPQVPAVLVQRDELVRPQVLAMRAWGGQSLASGDYTYVQSPSTSRARGGTANGGVMFMPPRFEMEDYYGVNSALSVTATTGANATTSYVLAAPGVVFALGLPRADGTLLANAVTIAQDYTVGAQPLVVRHNSTEIVRGYDNGTDVVVELGQGGHGAIRIPTGTTAQRPAVASGLVRINTSGANHVVEFYDTVSAAWVTLSSGGGGGTTIQVNGGAVSPTANWNGTTPAAPAGALNAVYANSGANISCSISATGLLDVLGSTRGSVLYRGASAWVPLTPGTAGQFLTTQGAGADPTWTTSSGGVAIQVNGGAVTPTANWNGTTPAAPAGALNASWQVSGSSISCNISASGLLGVISTTRGVLLYYNGSAWVSLGTGSAGQYLQTQGAGADPRWFSSNPLYASQTSVAGGDTVTNSAAATTFATTKTIGAALANTVGTMIRVTASGTMVTQAGSSTQKFELMLAGASVASTGAMTVGKSLTLAWRLVCEIVVDTTGATGTVDVQGTCWMGNATAAAGTAGVIGTMGNTATATVDLTGTLSIGIRETMGNATASWSVTQRQLNVELLPVAP